jgi:tetratricopeptide (TPR) repeat protein
MRMEKKLMKLLSLLVLESLVLFFIISCSNEISMVKEKNLGLQKNMVRFFSEVRPSQGNPDSHYLLGCYFQERGSHREAIEEFQKVLLIDPSYVKAYNGMGVSYDLSRNSSKAIEVYQKALKINPKLDYVLNNLGYSYLLQSHIHEAISAFEKAIALNPKETRYHNNLGLAFAQKDQFELAFSEFVKAGDASEAHYNIARLHYERGRYHEARGHYAKALGLNPQSTMARTGAEVVNALARIFQPSSHEIGQEALVEADSPTVDFDRIDTLCRAQIATHILRTANLEREKAPLSSQQGEKRRPNSISKQETGIEISNGNGVNRMARRVGNYLQERGLSIVRLTNANHFKHRETKIFYREGYDEVAGDLEEQLPMFQGTEVKQLDRANVKVKVLIGKDLVPYNKMFKEGRS